MNLPPEYCECGESLYEESRRANGWWKDTFNHVGEDVETSLDYIKLSMHPKTVTCCGCGKRYLNPRARHEN